MGGRRPRVLAHRGASGHALENTLEAFRAARTLGADGVELDVHGSLDGVMVVHHDASIPGLGAIAALSRARISHAQLGNGEAVPTLQDVLQVIPGLEVWIEIKGLGRGQEVELLAAITRGPGPERCRVHSFDHGLVGRLHRLAPELPLGLLTTEQMGNPAGALAAAGAVALWPAHRLVDADLVSAVHGASAEVIAWTVNDPAEARRLASCGVDALCGNYPERLRLP